MKFSEVTEQDVRLMAQLANMLNAGHWDLVGKELCAAADTIRWFQRQAQQVAQEFAAGPPAPPPVDSGGLKVKAYNPGKTK